MIEEEAIVLAVNGRHLTLQAQPSSACSSCKAKSSCGQGLLSRFFNQQPGNIVIENDEGREEFARLKAGDRVIIGIEENAVLQGAFYAYMLPLLFMLLFAGLSQWFAVSAEWLQLVISIAGLLFGISLARWLLGNSKNGRQHLKHVLPTLLRKYPDNSNVFLKQETL